MSVVLVPLAKGFEEIEAVTVVDILRRAEVRVVVAGESENAVEGSRGVRVVPDIPLSAAEAEGPYDMVVLPGGAEGTDRLRRDAVVRRIVESTRGGGGKVAAICAAPTLLHAWGMLDGAPATCHPACEADLSTAELSHDRAVVHGDLVTSRAAGTAMEFAFRLVEVLCGEAKRDEVNEGVLARL